MSEKEFNPLADIADILGSIARGLFPSKPQQSPPSRTQFSKPSSKWQDVRDELMVQSMKRDAEERKRRGLMPLVFE